MKKQVTIKLDEDVWRELVDLLSWLREDIGSGFEPDEIDPIYKAVKNIQEGDKS